MMGFEVFGIAVGRNKRLVFTDQHFNCSGNHDKIRNVTLDFIFVICCSVSENLA